jgi:hypothetical protein
MESLFGFLTVAWVGILEELLKYNLVYLVITNCVVITNGTLTKDDLSFIVESLERTSAACSCLVITTNLSPMNDEEFRHWLVCL